MDYLINKTRFHVLEQGSSPFTLVFLHYFGGSSLEWQAVMSQLTDQYHCVALDLRGHGDSDAPATGYSVNDMADDVAGLMRKMNIREFVLVGHSLSSKVALALASRQPAGLRALILIAPSPAFPEPIPEADRTDMLETHGQRSAAEKTFANITAVPLSAMVREQIIADNLRTSDVAWKAWLTGGSKEDISSQMSTLNVPISIIVGTEDRAILPDFQVTRILPSLKNATLDIIQDAGHLLPWETPDELATFIRRKVVLSENHINALS